MSEYIVLEKSPVHGHYAAVVHNHAVCLEGGLQTCKRAALAMNAHDQLVEALKVCVNRLRNQGGNISEMTAKINSMNIQQAEAALAAAQVSP